MAISATTTLTPSMASFGDPVRVSVEVDNPDLDAVDIVSIKPSGDPALQRISGMQANGLLDGLSVTIPGGEAVTFKYTLYPYSQSPSQIVRVYVLTADGQLVVEDATLTIV